MDKTLMDTVFKALADPTRRTLLDRLYVENGQTLNKLCETLGMSRQAVTQHLALLEQAQLVVVLWRRREKLHYLNPTPIHEIYERWISKYERHRLQALSDLKQQLEAEENAPTAKTASKAGADQAKE
jgi:DNA-binding transcriptional ArsR family regulator